MSSAAPQPEPGHPDRAPQRCPCGRPLHYADPAAQLVTELLVESLGAEVAVATPAGTWMVPRHYIALHGVRADQLPEVAELFGFPRAPAGDAAAFVRDFTRIALGDKPPDCYLVIERGEDVWTLVPLLGERAQITRGDPEAHKYGTYAECWQYDSLQEAGAALQAHLDYSDSVEPQGWVRHLPSNRRRPGGDLAREEIRP